MKLTGKCKEAFLKYCKQTESFMETYEDIYLNALIIEFFDSVGIYITIEPFKNYQIVYFDVSINFELHSVWKNRHEATNEAIIKANEIYNHGKTS